MTIDLAGMSKKELLQLQKCVASAWKNADIKARQEARLAAEKAAAEFG